MRSASRRSLTLLSVLLAAVVLCTLAQPGLAQTLDGVSCDDVMAAGAQGALSSPLGTTSALTGSQLLPMRSGFDYLESWVWVRSLGAACPNGLNDFFICVETAGRFGDADGDGSPWSSGGACSNHPFLSQFPSGADGLDPTNDALLAATESYGVLIDRNCDGAYDLQLSIRGGTADPQLRVDVNFVNGGAVGPAVGTLLGGHGVTYEFTSTMPGTDTWTTCPDPQTLRGHILVNIPNWDSFFAAPGLNPGQFEWAFDNGNNQDQVAEDQVGGTYDQFAPGLQITKNPDLALCVGEPGTLTVTVTNNSNAAVSNIQITDTLPLGWDFTGVVNGGGCVSGGNQVGNVITFTPAFDLAPCEECVITFNVAPNGNCEEGDNVAQAVGEASSYCIEGGVLTTLGVGPVQDTSHLVCNQPPCVQLVDTDGPPFACIGDDIQLSATVLNCSTDTEDIEVCIAGQCTTFVDVPGGATRTHTVTATMTECSPAAPACFPVSYSASNVCGTDDGGSTEICVDCGTPPCVELVGTQGPDEACVGADIQLSATVRNCSVEPEDIEVCVAGQCTTFVGVAPQGEVTHTVTSPMIECGAAAPACYAVTYSAGNQCGDVDGTPTQICVDCLPLPCVELVRTNGPEYVCEGQDFEMSATVRNCSPDVENVTVCVADQCTTFVAVPPGGEVTQTVTRTMPECTGQPACYPVSYGADNVCDEVSGTPTEICVECAGPPCVELVETHGPDSACAGDDVQLSATVRNCSVEPEDIEVCVAGQCTTFVAVPAQGLVTHTVTTAMPQCTPDAPVCFDVAYSAGNRCGDVDGTPTEICVDCGAPPCVEPVPTDPPGPACQGEDIDLSATFRNCSPGPENITVCIAGQCTTFVAVAPDDQVTHTVTVTMPECVENQPPCWEVTYSAANSCGDVDGTPYDICVDCRVPEVRITKSDDLPAGECAVSDVSTVTYTLEVTNTGPTDLETIEVHDVFDCVAARYVGNSSAPPAGTEPPSGSNGELIWTTPGPLGPGESLTFTYQLQFTVPADACGDTMFCDNDASVTAYCADAQAGDETSHTTCVVCQRGEACPRTIGFWRQQCAQKGNGSTKVCLEGMYGLWDCVLNSTGVTQWLNNDGSYTSTASVYSMSDADRFAFLCSQLQGPRPMTLHDMTEIQYLGLMLNVCVEALPTYIQLENGMTVGELIAGIEDVLNNGGNYGYWETLADNTNNRIGVLAADCPIDPVRNVDACVNGDSGSLQQSLFDQNVNAVLVRAVPNPVSRHAVSIQYRVPDYLDQNPVQLNIYSVTGRLVRSLPVEVRSAGDYQMSWDLNGDDGGRVPAGIYFYQLKVGSEQVTRRLVVTW